MSQKSISLPSISNILSNEYTNFNHDTHRISHPISLQSYKYYSPQYYLPHHHQPPIQHHHQPQPLQQPLQPLQPQQHQPPQQAQPQQQPLTKSLAIPNYHYNYQPAVSSSPTSSYSSNQSSPKLKSASPVLSQPNKKKTRNNLPKETTYILLKWLNQHLNHPYPNSFEKNQLMLSTGLNQQQLSNWFINARRRKIKVLKLQNESR